MNETQCIQDTALLKAALEKEQADAATADAYTKLQGVVFAAIILVILVILVFGAAVVRVKRAEVNPWKSGQALTLTREPEHERETELNGGESADVDSSS